jgi:biopolymer transport protein ExbD
MRFKTQQKSPGMLEVNLVPMMDVLLTVLTFFIIISMTLTSQQSVDVTLPSANAGLSQQKKPDPLIIGLNQQGQILLANQPTSRDQLAQQMQTYLTQHSQGAVILKADRKLPYEEVVRVLGDMRDIGGDRVSLAIEHR